MLANDRASEDSSRRPRAGSNQDRRDGAERLEAIVVTPAGFEPAISTLKGSRPGPG